jgi:hypothetical protein
MSDATKEGERIVYLFGCGTKTMPLVPTQLAGVAIPDAVKSPARVGIITGGIFGTFAGA